MVYVADWFDLMDISVTMNFAMILKLYDLIQQDAFQAIAGGVRARFNRAVWIRI